MENGVDLLLAEGRRPSIGLLYLDGECDISGDGVVDVEDVLIMLGAWGPCD